MIFFFFNPFSKQYYFPQGYKKYPTFKSFYQPYTILGRVMWFIWDHSRILRSVCIENNPQRILPLTALDKYLNSNLILAYNRGTPGDERKLTAVGCDKKTREEFFLKYAESEITMLSVIKEGNILKQINYLDFVPEIKFCVTTENYSLLKTTFLKGNRLNKIRLDNSIISILWLMSKQKVNLEKRSFGNLKTCFAHGDFCPWNLIIEGKNVKVFDWEMAQYYPLGYDLFTFVFQTSFLITPWKSIKRLLKENRRHIDSYFDKLGCIKWNAYLKSYAKLKISKKSIQQNKNMLYSYKKLMNYVEEI